MSWTPQAGDLVTGPDGQGEWAVLHATWPGFIFLDPEALRASFTLLAPAKPASLFEALRGLPGARSGDGWVEVDFTDEIWLSVYIGPPHPCELRIGSDESRVDFKDTAPLEQAIQRYKALCQYIAAKEAQHG